ncbi:MAG: FHA domain-containing protein [Deltaproteobacteria bacterium]|nr:FHA domain-containing protein [Deltaproteobacteria bacterium]
MTTRSTGKKTLQNFHVRNALWNLFVERAEEMECSVDYLINEAMRLYASSHGFLEIDPDFDDDERPSLPVPQGPPVPAPRMKPTVPGRAVGVPSGPPLRRTGVPAPSTPPPLPPAPRSFAQGMHASTDPGFMTGTAPKRPPLTLIFQGSKVPITQDQFIIGRGSRSSDLAIKDANISRKHAAVIYHNGAYYMKDLGSTNGVEYKGKPVDSKRIDEGDVFSVCGYELHFTYNA